MNAQLMPYCGEESAPSYEEADDQIATELDAAELVNEVRNSAEFLDWIAHEVAIPARYLHDFRELDRRAKALSRRAGELVGEGA